MRASGSLPELNRSDPFTISPAVTMADATPPGICLQQSKKLNSFAKIDSNGTPACLGLIEHFPKDRLSDEIYRKKQLIRWCGIDPLRSHAFSGVGKSE
jgi:hypothetical protein